MAATFAAHDDNSIYALGQTAEVALQNAKDAGAQNFRVSPIDPEFASSIERGPWDGSFAYHEGRLVPSGAPRGLNAGGEPVSLDGPRLIQDLSPRTRSEQDALSTLHDYRDEADPFAAALHYLDWSAQQISDPNVPQNAATQAEALRRWRDAGYLVRAVPRYTEPARGGL